MYIYISPGSGAGLFPGPMGALGGAGLLNFLNQWQRDLLKQTQTSDQSARVVV